MTEETSAMISEIKKIFKSQAPDLTSFCLKVIIAIIVFFIGIKLIRWLIGCARRYLARTNMDAGAVQFLCSVGKALLYLLLVLNIAMSLGLQASSVAALLGTVGVTIGLGLQGGLSNLAGGVLLLIFKPFVVGDYIIQDKSSGCEGTVKKIEMCYTTLLTVDNRYVVIPNGTLANVTIVNDIGRERSKMEIKAAVSYSSDIQKAKDILREIAMNDPVTREHLDSLEVFVDELGESAVILGFHIWVDPVYYRETRWRLNEEIKLQFDKNDIEIPFNQLDVYMHQK